MQYEKSATWKYIAKHERVQHEKCAIWNKCNIKKIHTKKVQHEKRETWKQHKEGETSETLNMKVK